VKLRRGEWESGRVGECEGEKNNPELEAMGTKFMVSN